MKKNFRKERNNYTKKMNLVYLENIFTSQEKKLLLPFFIHKNVNFSWKSNWKIK